MEGIETESDCRKVADAGRRASTNRESRMAKTFLPEFTWRRMAVGAYFALNVLIQTVLFQTALPIYLLPLKGSIGRRDFVTFLLYDFLLFSAVALAIYLSTESIHQILRRTTHARWLAGALAVCSEWIWSLLLLLDTKTYQVLGLHVYSDFIRMTLHYSEGFRESTHFSGWTVATFAVVAIVLFWAQALMFTLCNAASRRLPMRGTPLHRCLRWALVALAFLWSTTAMTGNYLKNKAFNNNEAVFDALFLHEAYVPAQDWARANYPAETEALPQFSRKPDILFIAADSLRSDIFNADTMPRLWEISQYPTCLHSDQHFSASNTTEYAYFSLLYSLYPMHFKLFGAENVSAHPLRILKANGYQLNGATAAGLRAWNHAEYMVTQMSPRYKEFLDGSSDRNDRKLASWFAQSYAERDPSKPHFYFLFFYSSHHNYYYPPEFEKYSPVLPVDFNYFLDSGKLLQEREKLWNRYRNSVLYVDSLVGEILEPYREKIKKGELIVAFVGDHGEEFFEYGLLGHAAVQFQNPRVSTPLLFCLPGGQGVRVAVSSHLDLFPTIFDALTPGGFKSRFLQGMSLLRKEAATADRMLLVTPTGFPETSNRFVLVTPQEKLEMKLAPGFDKLSLLGATDLQDRELSADRMAALNRTLGLQESNTISEIRRYISVDKK